MASHGMESQVGSVLGAPAIAVAVPAAGADWLREGATYPEPCCWVAPLSPGGCGRRASKVRVPGGPMATAKCAGSESHGPGWKPRAEVPVLGPQRDVTRWLRLVPGGIWAPVLPPRGRQESIGGDATARNCDVVVAR